ncbi:MAG: phosphohistidine phosphatase SixA [Candidatus Eisenbacteria bacterium]|nr:phosphohistidine phosphatase SixA [Candidatus Eisenbacteria bacterium]
MPLETIYLVRHAQAVASEEDRRRPLSERGRQQAEYLVDALRELDLRVDILYHSDKSRAAETAEILEPVIAAQNGRHARRDLAPDDSVTDFLDDLAREEWKHVAIVGHLPFLERLASYLLAGDAERQLLHLTVASVAALVRGSDGWAVRWIVQPPAAL